MNKRSGVVFAYIAVIFWMAVIFYLSGQVATESKHLSTGITEWIMNMLDKILWFTIDIENIHHIVRKNAHFIAYLLLGVVVLNAVKRSGAYRLKGYAIALFICIVYAFSDEFHQLFVPGRSGELRDVFIDSAGAIVGISLFLGLCKMKNRNRN